MFALDRREDFCYAESMNDAIPRHCSTCGAKLPPPAARGRPRSTCSRACRTLPPLLTWVEAHVDEVAGNMAASGDLGTRRAAEMRARLWAIANLLNRVGAGKSDEAATPTSTGSSP